jgi:dTDP-4-dehydrorhamnose reductase
MKEKIIVTGANGQLAFHFMALSPSYTQYDFEFLTSKDLNLEDSDALNDYFSKNSCAYVINCAAYTQVDAAESNQKVCDTINHQAVKLLGSLALAYHFKLIHFSTDFVFDGLAHSPYREEDTTNPRSIYGETKLLGEKALQIISKGQSDQFYAIIRTSWVYSFYGKNFYNTMKRLASERSSLNVVIDQVGTPTYAHDLAKFILDFLPHLIQNDVYHFSNQGVCSWYDFANEIIDLHQLPCAVAPILSKDYPTAASRPHYSVLDKTKLNSKFSFIPNHWKKSLYQCFQDSSRITL